MQIQSVIHTLLLIHGEIANLYSCQIRVYV